jgi:SAM-dependent methyltransferase
MSFAYLYQSELRMTKQNPNDICLNIGCGDVCPDDWHNIDASMSLRISKIPLIGRSVLSLTGAPNWSHSVKYGDIVKGLPNKHDFCQLIFACHVLEHLSIHDFQHAMKNIYSCLKPGGIFRIIVPDLEQYISIYINNRADDKLSHTASHAFMINTWLGHRGSRSSFVSRLLEGFSNSRHQWMWDEPSLLAEFTQYGFGNIRRCYYGDWSDSRFAAVEKECNYINAIGIEGMK